MVTTAIIIAIARTTKPTNRYLAVVDSPKSAVVALVNTIGDKNPPAEGDTTDTSAVAVADVDLSTASVETINMQRGNIILKAMPTTKTEQKMRASDDGNKLSSI